MKAFDEEVYGRIAGLLPPERLAVHLASFEQQLRDCLYGPADEERMKSGAHKLIAQAGMLGFMELSERCGDLEAACEAGGPVEAPLAAARAAAEQAFTKLAELRGGGG